eukprot:5271562-Prymnesium_polylepis.1
MTREKGWHHPTVSWLSKPVFGEPGTERFTPYYGNLEPLQPLHTTWSLPTYLSRAPNGEEQTPYPAGSRGPASLPVSRSVGRARYGVLQ